MRHFKRMALITTLATIAALAPTASIADEKLEGKVVGTNLTFCQPRPNGGGCAGTLTLETKADGTAQKVAIKVVADTIIRKGNDYLLLPATQGNSVVVSFVTGKGEKVAKSVDVISAAR